MEKNPEKFCRKILQQVSRSFALTIPLLDKRLKDAVLIVYLQDRLLDNFEDELPAISLAQRRALMDKVVAIFAPQHQSLPPEVEEIKAWADEFNDKALQKMVAGTDKIWQAYQGLEQSIQRLSFDWLTEMNQGMQEYLQQEIKTFADLDEYCYYVAGTVGGFLTDLLLAKTEVSTADKEILKANFTDAGLFLQKVNITRDIKEDIAARERIFWPLPEFNLEEEELLQTENKAAALEALSEMVSSTAKHIEPLLEYYQAIPAEFTGYRRFFAVNNALGLATLSKLKDNPQVFWGAKPVKVGKLTLARILKSPEKNLLSLADDFLKEFKK